MRGEAARVLRVYMHRTGLQNTVKAPDLSSFHHENTNSKNAFQVTVLLSPGGWCLPAAGSVMSAPEQLYFQ